MTAHIASTGGTLFPPVLLTPRLTLTLLDLENEDDVGKFMDLMKDPEFVKHLGTMGIDTPDDLRALARATVLQNDTIIKAYANSNRPLPADLPSSAPLIYSVRLGHSNPRGENIGTVSIGQRGAGAIPDQGWALFGAYAGKGYATEASAELLRYARDEFGLHDILVVTSPKNPGSYGIAKKLGYVQVDEGMRTSEGDVHNLYILPGMEKPSPDALFRIWGDEEP